MEVNPLNFTKQSTQGYLSDVDDLILISLVSILDANFQKFLPAWMRFWFDLLIVEI